MNNDVKMYSWKDEIFFFMLSLAFACVNQSGEERERSGRGEEYEWEKER